MKNTITISVGDESNDGHSQHESYVFETNLTKQEINEAYDKGKDIIGFDFCNEIASEYEDNSLPEETYNLLMDHGIDPFKEEFGIKPWVYKDEITSVDRDSFIITFLKIAKLGNSKATFKLKESKDSEIFIGGYGLFSS